MRSVLSALSVYNRSRNAIQHDEAFLRVLHEARRNDEDRHAEFGNVLFPIPTEVADFAISAPRVHFEQSHFSVFGFDQNNFLAERHAGTRQRRGAVRKVHDACAR